MNDKELAAVHLALEALLINCGGNTEGIGKEAITALQSIIEQPAPVQEPVAWRLWDEEPGQNPRWQYYDKSDFKDGVNPMDMFPQLVPLCTAAQQKPWVGLDSLEVSDLWLDTPFDDCTEETFEAGRAFVEAIEAKLKEKNT